MYEQTMRTHYRYYNFILHFLVNLRTKRMTLMSGKLRNDLMSNGGYILFLAKALINHFLCISYSGHCHKMWFRSYTSHRHSQLGLSITFINIENIYVIIGQLNLFALLFLLGFQQSCTMPLHQCPYQCLLLHLPQGTVALRL